MIQLEVWGNYALLSRPELKVERVSYEVLTPSAARGIVEAIYYHPGSTVKTGDCRVLSGDFSAGFSGKTADKKRKTVENPENLCYEPNPLYQHPSERSKKQNSLFRCTQRDAGNRERALPCHAPADRSACSHGVAGRSLCD